ncbi:MAG: hypothetical protein IJ708_09740 [Clostridia bacterium]|nr:hypothetical protein [Clostridia bacterium]
MGAYSSFETPFQYSDQDNYIRAIRENMIRKNGDIKRSAFRSKRGGVSVTRSNDELYDEAIGYMKTHFQGYMGVFQTSVCDSAEIAQMHKPSPGHNAHHWELFGDEDGAELSTMQIAAIIVKIVIAS